MMCLHLRLRHDCCHHHSTLADLSSVLSYYDYSMVFPLYFPFPFPPPQNGHGMMPHPLFCLRYIESIIPLASNGPFSLNIPDWMDVLMSRMVDGWSVDGPKQVSFRAVGLLSLFVIKVHGL